MRTDSVNLSELAVNASRETISNLMGERYVHNRHFATKTKGAQEAHEAIRPTYMENAKIEGTPQERKRTTSSGNVPSPRRWQMPKWKRQP